MVSAMPKTRTTLTIDEDVLRSARVAAAHRGMKEGELIEEAIARYLGIGVFERIWGRIPDTEFADMTEDEIMDLAVREQHAARADRSR